MAANFHSDSNLAVAASALILSAMTVISVLIPRNSFSRPDGSSSSSSSSSSSKGDNRDLNCGLPGYSTESFVA